MLLYEEKRFRFKIYRRRCLTYYISFVSLAKNHVRNGEQVFAIINNSGPRGNHSLTQPLHRGWDITPPLGQYLTKFCPCPTKSCLQSDMKTEQYQIQKTAILKPVICISSQRMKNLYNVSSTTCLFSPNKLVSWSDISLCSWRECCARCASLLVAEPGALWRRGPFLPPPRTTESQRTALKNKT